MAMTTSSSMMVNAFFFVIPTAVEESLTISVLESASGQKYLEISRLRST